MKKNQDLKSKILNTAASTVQSNLLNNEGIKNNIVILEELKELIKPLTEEEYKQLKANIIANGCQDSLKIWQTTEKVVDVNAIGNEEVFILIDGHNRYQICKETNTNFNILLMKFTSLDEVKDWMVMLQLGRRNVSANELSYYRGLLYKNALKEDVNSKKEEGVKEESGLKKKSVQVAEQFNLNEKTIRRDKDFSEGIDKLDSNLKKDILSGKQKITKQKIQDLGKLEIADKIETIEEIEAVLEESKIEAPLIVNPVMNDEENNQEQESKFEDKKGKHKNTLIPPAQRNNLIAKFDKFMKSENLDDLTNFQNLLKAAEKVLKR